MEKILIIAPHPDDEVLGCGGTIAKYADRGDDVFVAIVTKGMSPIFSEESVEQVRKECIKADCCLGVKETIFMDFPAVKLEEIPRNVLNLAFVKLVQDLKPSVVYLPHHGDMQLDHKLTVDAAMVALRPKYNHVVSKIYAYETVSETGWDIPNVTNEFIPNLYNDISDYLNRKLDAMSIFKSQLGVFPDFRSLEAIQAMAIYRGTSMGLSAAEAFMIIREIWKKEKEIL